MTEIRHAPSLRPPSTGPWVASGPPLVTFAAVAVVLLGGMGLLLSRRLLLDPAVPRTALTAILFSALLAGSLLVPSPERIRARGAMVAAGAGVATLVLGALLLPPIVPLPPIVAAVPFALLAAIAEEAFFRRAMFGTIERAIGWPWATVAALLTTAVLFAAIHVPLYGTAALPLDLGAGLLLSWQRSVSGSWLLPAATHVAFNLVAVLV